jgi:hypothetical protein
MWSIKDKQNDRMLASGRNSSTKDEALECAWEYWVGIDGQELTDEELEELYEKKEEWLRNIGLKPIEHDEPI